MTKHFLFLDIETTGLDPDHDSILEIAWAFTDENFVVQGVPFTAIVDHADKWGKAWNDLKHAPQVVRDMHNKSGLLGDLLNDEVTSAQEYEIRNLLQREIREHKKAAAVDVHLAGFSVHFDESFLRASKTGWGNVLDSLHHRHYDLSVIKIHLELRGEVYKKAENLGAHRALNDVFESIEQARIFSRTVGLL